MYAVDASDITNHTTKIVDCNGLGGKIEVIQCRGEDLQLSEQVDLIISEWMGTLLLVSSFPSVHLHKLQILLLCQAI